MTAERPTLVLVHGLAIVQHAGLMFGDVPEVLQNAGFRVFRTIVQGDGSLEELSDRLWGEVSKVDGPVALLCHSMGGLEARTFLLDDSRCVKLRAIVTVGSPHAGTPLARPAVALNRAYQDLTVAARTAWVHRHVEAEHAAVKAHGIRLGSAIAKTVGAPRVASMKPGWLALRTLGAGPNDGLVPAASQVFGERLFDVDLDHAETVALGVRPAQVPAVHALWLRMARWAVET